MSSFYKQGATRALSNLGLGQNEDSHTGRNVAVGAAAAAPFTGLIGRQKIINDPFTNRNIKRVNLRQLENLAQAGDIVVTTDPARSGWKLVQAPTQGTEFYHSFPVVEGKAGRPTATALTAGEFSDPEYQKMKPSKLKGYLDRVREGLKAEGYRDAVLLRPSKSLSPNEIEELQKTLLERSKQRYDLKRGIVSYLRDLFVPTLPGITGRGGRICNGDVCSTLPAQSIEQASGQKLVPGKASKHVNTSDLLREGTHLKPIAAHVSAGPTMSPRMLRALNLGVRGGVGLGLAGSAYALSEDPALAAAPVGAVGATIGARKILPHVYAMREQRAINQLSKKLKPRVTASRAQAARKRGYNAFRPMTQLLQHVGSTDAKSIAKLKNIKYRTIPLALAGGAAAYLGTRGLEKLTQD